MNETIEVINDFLGPVLTGKLGQALIGLAILIIGMIIVKLITGVLLKTLKSVGFLFHKNDDGSVTDFATPIGSLVKGVLTIFVLMAVLQHFGLTNVLAPLQEMLNKFTSAVPNIIGAGVIAYAGWIIATIVSELVGIGLGKVDEQIAARTGDGDFKVAKFGSAFMFGAILLPILVSALGVLAIPAISDPASAMIQKLMAAVPNIVGAGIILLVTYFVTKFVIFMLMGLLEGANINAVPTKLGIEGFFTESFTPTKLISSSIMFFSMLSAAIAAVNVLGISVISTVFRNILDFGGGILVGAIILIIGNLLSSIAYNKMSENGNTGLANIARFAILGLVLAMGLKSMGLADDIVHMAFGFTLGSVAIAVALAFGLGGRDAAKAVADSWAKKIAKD